MLVLLSGYLLFEFGRIQADYNIVDAAEERAAYEAQIAGLEAQIADLKQEVAMHETHRDIDRKAYREVEADLVTLEAKIQEQMDAIAFYRGIVSPEDGNSGLRVQDLKLSRGRDENSYNVRVVLVQSLQHDRKVSGDVVLTLTGMQDGAERSYPYAELLPQLQLAPLAFEYAQEIGGLEQVLPIQMSLNARVFLRKAAGGEQTRRRYRRGLSHQIDTHAAGCSQ